MLKLLFPDYNWYEISCAGFDLDGTIYDEFQFICQVYEKIVDQIILSKREHVLFFMKSRWLEKGSSYPLIYKEAKQLFKLHDDFENASLHIFKNFVPKLTVPYQIRYLLEVLRNEMKYLFLITNGKSKLQNEKIEVLNIRHFFNDIIVAENYEKPNVYYGLSILNEYKLSPNQIIYFGDSESDKDFALKCQFNFKMIKQSIF